MAEKLLNHVLWFVINIIPLTVFGLIASFFNPQFNVVGIAFLVVVAMSVSAVFEGVKGGISMLVNSMK